MIAAGNNNEITMGLNSNGEFYCNIDLPLKQRLDCQKLLQKLTQDHNTLQQSSVNPHVNGTHIVVQYARQLHYSITQFLVDQPPLPWTTIKCPVRMMKIFFIAQLGRFARREGPYADEEFLNINVPLGKEPSTCNLQLMWIHELDKYSPDSFPEHRARLWHNNGCLRSTVGLLVDLGFSAYLYHEVVNNQPRIGRLPCTAEVGFDTSIIPMQLEDCSPPVRACVDELKLAKQKNIVGLASTWTFAAENSSGEPLPTVLKIAPPTAADAASSPFVSGRRRSSPTSVCRKGKKAKGAPSADTSFVNPWGAQQQQFLLLGSISPVTSSTSEDSSISGSVSDDFDFHKAMNVLVEDDEFDSGIMSHCGSSMPRFVGIKLYAFLLVAVGVLIPLMASFF